MKGFVNIPTPFNALILGFLLSACAGEDLPTAKFYQRQDPLSLENTVAVVKTTPAADSMNVALTTEIIVDFSGPVTWGSVDAFRFRVEDEFGLPVEGVTSANKERTQLRFSPRRGNLVRPLKESTVYTVHVRYLRNDEDILVSPYHFQFRTKKQDAPSGNFNIVKIHPDSRVIFPSNKIGVEMNEGIALPTANDLPDPYCSRVQYADLFQIIVVRVYDNDGLTNIYPIQGKACVDKTNPKLIVFYPDADFPIFPEVSYVDIEIKASDGLRAATSDEALLEGRRESRWVTPNPVTILGWLFGGQAPQ
ncbi:MAG: hypothetical protein COV44_02440 [Deltaproteobacteria bacterium CG11_big_fil_rev_8_21_14_0_20_45_16]|nr:MAG: hypothetical protein COV44_02440 [Deltaproteobacteria bacterium CG11_big_fil_rev_8_21_14_0_20_45_16]